MNRVAGTVKRGWWGLLAVRAVCAAVLIASATPARANVGPPVSIKMPPDRSQAVSGQTYHGEFMVVVYERGSLSDIRLVGKDWTVVSLEAPSTKDPIDPGTFRVRFQAIPKDADEPLALEITYNGRPTRRQYRVGPAAFAAEGRPRLLVAAQPPNNQRQAVLIQPPAGGVDGPTPHGGTLTVQGRIVYDRPGLDNSDPPDGDFDDPEDVQPISVGADGILVELWDVDPITDELMWRGLTTESGHFITPPLDADVDTDGSGPDLKLIVYAKDFDEFGVLDPDEDDYYFWQTPEIEDFNGSTYNYGTLRPQNAADHPAIHVYNSLIRARRFISEKPGYATPPVRAVWPVAEWSHYQPGPQEIHLFEDHTWQEDTVVHEFGHHFIYSLHTPPPVNYNNGICDGGTAEGDCFPNGGTFAPGPGHCVWCRETQTDAWNEGWPNWLADVVLRDFPLRYEIDPGGAPYVALFSRGYEMTSNCCVDGMAHDPLRTEGFVSALLRDIEDANFDDHNTDGIRDMLCLGPNPIFDTLVNELPTTVTQFLTAFRTRYPQQTANLSATAFNVGGSAYLTGFPADTQPPGAVIVCDSPSHPLGAGGAMPCMRIEWEPASDDASGACHYSYILTTDPAGLEPDESADPISASDGCRLRVNTGVYSLGNHYFSIKAQDAAGNWSSQWATFGPFTVLDCNGSGLLDLCDITCNSDGIPGACSFSGVCLFGPGVNCGQSSDCNGNYVPDECDIAQGASADCNRDGIPDECQTAIIKNFIGVESPEWGAAANWQEGAEPVDGDHVCVPTGTPQTEVSFKEDFRRVATLNCDIDFRLNDTSAELRIDEPSYISGDLTLTVGSTLRAMTSLDVFGELDWRGHEIHGPGTVNVFGGLDLSSPVARPKLRNSAHLSILEGDVNIHGDEYLELYDTSSFSIGLPVTYTYEGNFNIFAGGPTTIVNVHGSLIRDSGTLTATIGSFVLNSGLIHNRTGNLTLSHGGTHSGFVIGDPGTLLRLNGPHDFLASSSLVGDDITFGNANFSVNSFVRGELNIADVLLIAGGICTITSDADVASYGQHLIVTSGSARLEAPSDDPLVTVAAVTIGDTTTEGSKDARFNTGQPVTFNTLNLVKGDIHGVDPITIHNAFIWGTGGGSILAGGPINCLAPATIQATSSARNLARVFNNHAYATFHGGFSVSGGSASFNNLATGTIELRGNSTGLFGGASTNAGLIVKTQGVGAASSLSGLNNSGQVHAQVGEISFGTGGTNSGAIVGDAGTLLRFTGTQEMTPASSLVAEDIHLFNATANIRGAVDITGDITLDGGVCTFTNEAAISSYGQNVTVLQGTLNFNAPVIESSPVFETVVVGALTSGGKVAHFNTGQPVTVANMNVIAGNITGPDSITVTDSFTWGTGGGTLDTGGAINSSDVATIQATSSNRSLRRVFNNHGHATLLGGFGMASGGAFNNMPTGTLDIRFDGTAFGLTTVATLQNDGLMIKSLGVGVSTIANHFRNAGVLELPTGTLELTGSNGLTHIQTAGMTILNGGSLRTTFNAPYQVQGGDLTGVGTITAPVQNTGGVVKPGLSAGTLAITGAYTQGAAGRLDIELGGPSPGESDLLTVSGAASLAGEIRVQTINGFQPTAGQTFVIMTAGSRSGTFATLSGTPGFEVSYTSTQVILTAVDSMCPSEVSGDCDGNGVLEPAADIPCFIAALLDPGTSPSCPVARSDVNQDGFTNGLDIQAMANCIIQGCQ